LYAYNPKIFGYILSVMQKFKSTEIFRNTNFFNSLILRVIGLANLIALPGIRDALSAAPGVLESLCVQFRVKTIGPPAGQSVLIHLGEQHAALRHQTLTKETQLGHFRQH